MKQYYQFMQRGVATDAQGLQTNANIDEFEEDLHKMLVVSLSPSAQGRRGVSNRQRQGCWLLHI